MKGDWSYLETNNDKWAIDNTQKTAWLHNSTLPDFVYIDTLRFQMATEKNESVVENEITKAGMRVEFQSRKKRMSLLSVSMSPPC